MTKNRSKKDDETTYAMYQRRDFFVRKYENGWELYNNSPMFRAVTMSYMHGASVYDLLLELISMVDGQTTPTTTHLKPDNSNPTHHETK